VSIYEIDREEWHAMLEDTISRINRSLWSVHGERWESLRMVDSGRGPAGRAGQERACCTAGGALAGDTGGATGVDDLTGADAGTGDGADQ
jgi:hypothetical protein